MYRLATKKAPKKRIKERHIRQKRISHGLDDGCIGLLR